MSQRVGDSLQVHTQTLLGSVNPSCILSTQTTLRSQRSDRKLTSTVRQGRLQLRHSPARPPEKRPAPVCVHMHCRLQVSPASSTSRPSKCQRKVGAPTAKRDIKKHLRRRHAGGSGRSQTPRHKDLQLALVSTSAPPTRPKASVMEASRPSRTRGLWVSARDSPSCPGQRPKSAVHCWATWRLNSHQTH